MINLGDSKTKTHLMNFICSTPTTCFASGGAPDISYPDGHQVTDVLRVAAKRKLNSKHYKLHSMGLETIMTARGQL